MRVEPITIYCDTNVYIDYLEDRRDNIRPLGEFALRVLQRIFAGEFNVVISDWLLREMEKYGAKSKMDELVKRLREHKRVIDIETTEADKISALKLPTNYPDALHAALAIRAKASCIVTTNIKDFLPIKDKIDCISPNYL